MNKFYISGRLTRDPRQFGAGDKVCANITLAVQKTKDTAEFLDITVFDKTAEAVLKYSHKGDLLLVEGAIGTFKKENEFARIVLNGTRVEFLSSKKGDSTEASVNNALVDDTDLPF